MLCLNAHLIVVKYTKLIGVADRSHYSYYYFFCILLSFLVKSDCQTFCFLLWILLVLNHLYLSYLLIYKKKMQNMLDNTRPLYFFIVFESYINIINNTKNNLQLL